jgi:pimeloyl-ACP methyl ester carboxylesterase
LVPAPLTIPVFIVVAGFLFLTLAILRLRSPRLQARAKARRVTEYVLLSLVVVVTVFMILGTPWNIWAHDRFVASHPAPGQMYDVNGYKMHMLCLGKGSPTILIESGLGASSPMWQKVQPGLAETTRVCAYDRAGLGWSEPQPGPRDSDHIVDQLHALLQVAGIHGPLVLMGHSGGGFFIREYATKYPQEVVGLIFVDAGTPRIQLRGSKELQAENFKIPWPKLIAGDVLLNMGATRLAGKCKKIEPTHDWGAVAVQAEMECFPPIGTDLKELEAVTPDGEETYRTGPYSFPILIISQSWSDTLIMPHFSNSRLDSEAIKMWNDLQEEMKNLSPDSRRIIARNTGHLVMAQRPDILLKEIPPFIARIRQNGPPTDLNKTTVTE